MLCYDEISKINIVGQFQKKYQPLYIDGEIMILVTNFNLDLISRRDTNDTRDL
jgi:hypothetical protein